jgi:hypothetical protein
MSISARSIGAFSARGPGGVEKCDPGGLAKGPDEPQTRSTLSADGRFLPGSPSTAVRSSRPLAESPLLASAYHVPTLSGRPQSHESNRSLASGSASRFGLACTGRPGGAVLPPVRTAKISRTAPMDDKAVSGDGCWYLGGPSASALSSRCGSCRRGARAGVRSGRLRLTSRRASGCSLTPANQLACESATSTASVSSLEPDEPATSR